MTKQKHSRIFSKAIIFSILAIVIFSTFSSEAYAWGWGRNKKKSTTDTTSTTPVDTTTTDTITVAVKPTPPPPPPSTPTTSNGLVTNEYAYYSPTDSRSIISPIWEMTSGSLFMQNGQYWTGIPDLVEPNYNSSNGNDSAIFRMTTKNATYQNVSVSFNFTMNNLVGLVLDSSTGKPPAWDGGHLFLRYQNQTNLYYASFSRRDGLAIIKKKCTGGTENGGTYYALSPAVKSVLLPGPNFIKANIKNVTGGVKIDLYINNLLVTSTTDTGVGCSPITAAGKVGIRGDNANFNFNTFTVASI